MEGSQTRIPPNEIFTLFLEIVVTRNRVCCVPTKEAKEGKKKFKFQNGGGCNVFVNF